MGKIAEPGETQKEIIVIPSEEPILEPVETPAEPAKTGA
jgi:hypothetical protein